MVREVDASKADPSRLGFTVASFIRRIQALFLEGSCLKTGFTKIMMDMLKKPMTYFVRGHMLQCGSPEGVSAADAEWCLARMACYVRNAIAVVRAEFPDYILLNAFSIFNLQSDDLCSRHKNRSAIPAGGANFQEKVSTLAKTFGGGDVEKFQAQFLRVQRVAQAVATEETGADNSREAFRTAVLRMRSRTKPKSDMDGMALAVGAFVGWQIGTGDIERCYCVHERHFCNQSRSLLSRQREQDIMTLTSDYVQNEANSVIDEAIEIWKKLYYNVTGQGAVREGRTIRFGVPQDRKRKADKPTLTDVLKKRRREAEETVKSSCPVVSRANLQALTAPTWTPTLSKEENHMSTKRARRAMEFVASGGHLPAKEMGGMSREEIIDIYEANEARLKKNRETKDATKLAAFKPRAPPALHGKLVKWEPDALACSATTRALRLRTAVGLLCFTHD